MTIQITQLLIREALLCENVMRIINYESCYSTNTQSWKMPLFRGNVKCRFTEKENKMRGGNTIRSDTSHVLVIRICIQVIDPFFVSHVCFYGIFSQVIVRKHHLKTGGKLIMSAKLADNRLTLRDWFTNLVFSCNDSRKKKS